MPCISWEGGNFRFGTWRPLTGWIERAIFIKALLRWRLEPPIHLCPSQRIETRAWTYAHKAAVDFRIRDFWAGEKSVGEEGSESENAGSAGTDAVALGAEVEKGIALEEAKGDVVFLEALG